VIDGAEKCILQSVAKPQNLVPITRLCKRRENLLRDFKKLTGNFFLLSKITQIRVFWRTLQEKITYGD
jgi:hypothetical protein